MTGRYRISGAIVAFPALILAALLASAQQPQNLLRPTPEAQQSGPKSGALVAMDSGQTLWIAPVEEKIKVIAANDYVIRRKDGFWRIRLEFHVPRIAQESASAGTEPAEAPNPPVQLWAVPLQSGGDALPWGAEPKVQAQDNQDAGANTSESSDSSGARGNPSEMDEPIRQELQFLSPDYISFFEQAGEYSETYHIMKVADDVQPRSGGTLPKLVVSEEFALVPDDVRSKDLQACANPDDDLSNADFLNGASESTYGIVRAHRKWVYAWLVGYNGGAGRGYHTGCDVSLLPPKSIVGANQIFPAWNAVKGIYPDALDVFASPTHDLVLVFCANRLMVAWVQDGKVGKPLARLELEGQPVMVQWALGKYVDAWTQQLAPYFGPYTPKPKTAQ